MFLFIFIFLIENVYTLNSKLELRYLKFIHSSIANYMKTIFLLHFEKISAEFRILVDSEGEQTFSYDIPYYIFIP